MSWQKRARLGVAVFAVLFAVGVYFALGERQKAAPLQPIERQDPTSTAEVLGGVLKRLSGADEEFVVSAQSQLSYPDGSEKLGGLRIDIRKRNGRDFVITADEALVGANESAFDLKQNIVLKASDGFELRTGEATFNTADEVVRAPGAVTFSRGTMTGSGVGMTYDERSQLLTLASESRMTLNDDAGMETTSFQAGASSLDRAANVLTLLDTVHVVREGQEFSADRGVARLSEAEEFVQYVELRGNARVAGGSAVDAMSAHDIDLDYTDDGALLERVILTGEAAVALKGAEGTPAREVHGGRLELTLGADGTVTRVFGQDGVRLALPADDDTPPRTITARTLDGTGEAGKGLTRVEFTEAVEFRENAAGASRRQARSQSLALALDANVVADAMFAGRVVFNDGALEARAEEARYSPARGTLGLSGGAPQVADEQVTIHGTTIDVVFETRHMIARGDTRTTYSATPAKSAGGKAPAARMPGLLEGNASVTVTAGSLDYTGSKSVAVYRGTVVLRQGVGTSIRADTVTLDQESGDLIASGNARAVIVNDGNESSRGSGDEIRYTDKTRVLSYVTRAPGKSQLVSAQGDLRAGRIDITLQKEGSGVARIDAQPDISIRVEQRTITGVRLEYVAAPASSQSKGRGSYVVHGTPRQLVTVIRRPESNCTTAMKLTLTEGTDNIELDSTGIGLNRVGPCAPASPAPTAKPPAPAPAR